jgi:hypothetical protein
MYLITLEGVFTSERQRFLMDQGYQFNIKRDAHIEAQVTAHTVRLVDDWTTQKIDLKTQFVGP